MNDWTDAPVFGQPERGRPIMVRPSAYGIVADPDQRIAIVRTPRGVFLPGGGREPGESVTATVEREAREECGMRVQVGEWRARAIEHVYSALERIHFEKRSVFCEAMAIAISGDRDELDHELAWVSLSDVVALLTPPSHRWAVGEWHARNPRK